MRWLDGLTDSKDMSLSTLQGVGDGQGGLACGSAWRCKESDTTETLNCTAAWAFSLVAVSRGSSLLWCAGFSMWQLLLSWSTECVGFPGCGMWAQVLQVPGSRTQAQ